MHIKIYAKELQNAVKEAVKFYENKMAAPFLKILWLQAKNSQVKILFTDSEIEFSCLLSNAEIVEEGIVGHDAKQFQEAANFFFGGIDVYEKENEIILNQDGKQYFLESQDASWSQEFDELESESQVVPDLKHIVDLIEPFGGKKPDLSLDYSQIENGRKIVCCDGKNLIVYPIYIPDMPENAYIKNKHLAKLKKWLTKKDTSVAYQNERLYFLRENSTVSLPIKKWQNWPNFHVIEDKFDDPAGLLNVEVKEFKEALAPFKKETMHLYIENGQLNINILGKAEMTIPARVSNENINTLLPVNSILHYLTKCGKKTVIIGWIAANEPVCFDNMFYVMPIPDDDY